MIVVTLISKTPFLVELKILARLIARISVEITSRARAHKINRFLEIVSPEKDSGDKIFCPRCRKTKLRVQVVTV